MTKSIRPIIRIHNSQTNEIIDREMNDDEFAQYQADKAALLIAQAEAKEKETQRQAILSRLGISAEELKTILG